MSVHKKLGAGLSEGAYEEALLRAFKSKGLSVEHQPRLTIPFEGKLLSKTFRPDFVIANEVVVEIKAVSALSQLHQAQLLTYMRLANLPLGSLINFNVMVLTHGIKRLIMTKAP
jgi:GxxExxY protein